jgi:hypothetical protein
MASRCALCDDRIYFIGEEPEGRFVCGHCVTKAKKADPHGWADWIKGQLQATLPANSPGPGASNGE